MSPDSDRQPFTILGEIPLWIAVVKVRGDREADLQPVCLGVTNG